MTTLPVLALLGGAVSPWFAITVGEAGDSCVHVRRVQPDGAAGMAGLRDGHCIARVNRTVVRTPGELLEELQHAKAKEPIALVLADGRVLVARPLERSVELEARYCEFVSSVETSVRVFIASEGAKRGMVELSLPGTTTLAEIRKLTGAQGLARLVQTQCEGPDAYRVMDEPAESVRVNNGSTVYFGYDAIDVFAIGRESPLRNGGDAASSKSDSGIPAPQRR
jgi:hypothetical protein